MRLNHLDYTEDQLKSSQNNTMTPAPVFTSRDTIAKSPVLHHAF